MAEAINYQYMTHITGSADSQATPARPSRKGRESEGE